ncbi:MAG: RtcB family protein [Candidatus Woesearchaeota archaeon]
MEYEGKLRKIGENMYELPKEGDMLVPGRLFISEKMSIDEGALEQIRNVAKLPGIVKYSLGLPDMHSGYGMCIGGVAAFDLEKGIISPGATGFDINCGVRILATNISEKEFMKKRKEILHDMKRTIPSGVGRGGERRDKETIKQVLIKGSEWAFENKLALKQDLQRTEENGRIKGANPKDVSERAIARGLSQLGTLGAGNHFIDILVVEEIFDEKTAKEFGLTKGNICIMIHCGSRGLGHQVASDYIQAIEKEYGSEKFPDRELGYAPINSELGKKYFSAMNCAINFAFCNRQIIMHKIRELLKRYYPNLKSNLVYDITHNISKIEKHKVDGKEKQLMVVRKGATRSVDKKPVLIPGSMSTPSFILVGTKEAEEKSFASSAHGAGRAHSRMWAHRELNMNQLKKLLEKKDILLEGSNKATIEESEFSYKDVEEVIDVTVKAGLGKKVAKLRPIAVMIG